MKYDRRDPSRAELLLTRAVHHLFYLHRKSGYPVSESRAFDAATETLFQAKREVKAEIKRKASPRFKAWQSSHAA